MTTTTHIDPRRCPLCGTENDCNMANNREQRPCWCREESFPQSLLDKVPPAATRRACICKQCAQTHSTDTNS